MNERSKLEMVMEVFEDSDLRFLPPEAVGGFFVREKSLILLSCLGSDGASLAYHNSCSTLNWDGCEPTFCSLILEYILL